MLTPRERGSRQGVYSAGDIVLGLEGEEELQEYEWEEAGTPGTDNSTQKPELCLTPSGTVGGTVGGSGSRIAGPEAKAGRQPSETAGPRLAAWAHPRAYFLFPRASGDPRHPLPSFSSQSSECLPPPGPKHPL